LAGSKILARDLSNGGYDYIRRCKLKKNVTDILVSPFNFSLVGVLDFFGAATRILHHADSIL
jgi:hypothetical protein